MARGRAVTGTEDKEFIWCRHHCIADIDIRDSVSVSQRPYCGRWWCYDDNSALRHIISVMPSLPS